MEFEKREKNNVAMNTEADFYQDTFDWIYDDTRDKIFENKKKDVISNYYIESKLDEEGYILDCSKKAKVRLSFYDGLFVVCSDGLIMGYRNNLLESDEKKYTNNIQIKDSLGFFPSLWKYVIVSDAKYYSIRNQEIRELFPRVYIHCQFLMALAKISNTLITFVHEDSKEIRHVWLSFDARCYEKFINDMNSIS